MTHPEAKLGYPEVSLGVCPAVVAPWLIKRIGAGPAREMLLAGGTLTGPEALERGLVTSVCPREELEEATMQLAKKLATGGQHAMAVKCIDTEDVLRVDTGPPSEVGMCRHKL